MQVNVFEAKNRLSELIKAAVAGEEVIIANRGEPVVRLVPTYKKTTDDFVLGTAQAILSWRKDYATPPYLRRSGPEIDQMIADERAGWD